MHLVGIAQSLGLFVIVGLATAALLSLAMVALARMERATIPVRSSEDHPRPTPSTDRRLAADRVSSPGRVTFGPRRW